MPEGVGLHFRSGEAIRPPYHRHQMRTASAHDPEKAAVLLEQGVDHVYLSPLFPPNSKPEDSRPVIPVEALHALLKHNGERIILLGGMIWERIEKLRQELPYDFSVGGITLFFPLS